MKAFKIIVFYFLSFTWGLPVTLIGAIVALLMIFTGHKPRLFHHLIYFEVGGEDWGGFSCGCFFVVNKNASLSMMQHECGHSLQNIVLGFLMPFVVSIPSAVRYWYREYLVREGKKLYSELPPYDSAWFEKSASDLGAKYFK